MCVFVLVGVADILFPSFRYNTDAVQNRIAEMGGLGQPLNIFLFQEIQRLSAVIVNVSKTLTVSVVSCVAWCTHTWCIDHDVGWLCPTARL